MNFEILEKYRFKNKPDLMSTKEGDDFGVFFIPTRLGKPPLKVLCAPMTEEWQQVSVSLPNKCPTWGQMSYVKKLFWGEDVEVVQFHPPKEDYINNHSFCLHLWRHKDGHKMPPSILVGLKSFNENIN